MSFKIIKLLMKLLAAIMIVLLPACSVIDLEEQDLTEPYKVNRVVDGDTICVLIGGEEEIVRLIGIDTPESVHPDKEKNTEEGNTASEYLKNLIEDEYVQLEYDIQTTDKYGRLLAYVYHDGKMVNEMLLESGHAELMSVPPNVKYQDRFYEIVAGGRI